MEHAVQAVKWAREYTDDVEFSAEDAVRSEMDFLVRIFDEVIKAGATTLNVPDTVGYSIPVLWGEHFKQLIARVPNSGQGDLVHALPQRPGHGLGQFAGGGDERRAPGGMHHQRFGRACGQCRAGRSGDGGEDAPRHLHLRHAHRYHADRADFQAGFQHHRLSGAAEQGHRRRQCLRARVRHPSGRRAQAPRDLRDHACRGCGLGREQDGDGQTFGPRRLPRALAGTGHRAGGRRGVERGLCALQGAGRQEARDLRRGLAGAGERRAKSRM